MWIEVIIVILCKKKLFNSFNSYLSTVNLINPENIFMIKLFLCIIAINNVCNFLMTLNAACNFLLYCALSDKYRKTVKELFLGRKMKRQNTMSSTYFSRYNSNQTGSSFYSKSPSNSGPAVDNSVRNRATNPKKSRFSITPTDYANFQAEMAVKNAKTQSLAAADFQTSEKSHRQNSVL